MNKNKFVLFFLIAMLLLAACVPDQLVKANALPVVENTQQAVTATGTVPLSLPTLIPTASEPPTVLPTQTPTQTPTVIPTQVPTQTSIPAPVYTVCNLAGFVADVSIPDYSVIDPGTAFTKTWRLQNVGACSWTSGYDLVFVSGDLMSGPTVVSLPYGVDPGGSVDISVNLVSPSDPGTYQGNWMLRDANGNLFGIRSNVSSSFWVRITVNSTASFAVTHVDNSVNQSGYSGVCPVAFTFAANI
jgi:hypothetical protein